MALLRPLMQRLTQFPAVTPLLVHRSIGTTPTTVKTPCMRQIRRQFLHTTKYNWNPIIEARDAHKIQTHVYKYNTKGFKVNENFLVGSVVLFPKDVFMWKVSSWEGITPESLEIFTTVTPRPEIVVLGLGDTVHRLPDEVFKFFKDNGMRLEVCDTRIACQQFNHFSDGMWQNVAAAMIPPTTLVDDRPKARLVPKSPSTAGTI